MRDSRGTLRGVYLFAFIFIFLFLPSRALRASALLGIGIYALSFVYSSLAARGLVIRRSDEVLRCYRNEPFVVSLKVENGSRFGFSGLIVLDRTGPLRAELDGRSLVSLPGKKRIRVSYSAVAPERGEFRIGPVSLKFSDPLGFFPRTVEFRETTSLIVYPETGRIGLKRPAGVPQGAVRVPDRAYEDVTRFRSIRPYIPGDDLRRINWKASARAQGLLTNEYLSSLTAPLMICLDLEAAAYPLRRRYDLIERAIEAAATLVHEAAAKAQPIGFATNGCLWGNESIPPMIPAPGNEIAVMDALARVSPAASSRHAEIPRNSSSVPLPRVLKDAAALALSVQLPGRCRLAFIGPCPDEATAASLLQAWEGGLSPELYLLHRGDSALSVPYSRFFQVLIVSEAGNDLIE